MTCQAYHMSSYITRKGLALHGTYWHEDFGRPHSHGCINLPTDVAFLIFRWSLPLIDFGKVLREKELMVKGQR